MTNTKAPAAAGPWIRVDSGERPEDGERVIVVAFDAAWEAAVYDADDDMFDDGDDVSPAAYWEHWAHIRPPEEP